MSEISIPDHLQKLIEKMFSNLNLELQPKPDVSLLLKPGDNWLGQLFAITAAGKDNRQRISVLNIIAKIAPCTKIHREVFDLEHAFEREVYMYTRVLPEFINVQKENKVKIIFPSLVKYYESSLDQNQETILFENMQQYGYRSINHRLPIDYKHMVLSMKALGKLHALSFALREQKPELFKELGRNTLENVYSNSKDYLLTTQNLGYQILSTLEKGTRAYKAFENFLKDPSFVIRETIKPELAGEYAIVCHGDFQTRNFLFKYDRDLNPDDPTDLCLIDWQLSRFCSPCSDISYLIWISTDKKLRDDHYEEFLDIYYTTFSSYLRDLKGSPEKSYPYNIFKEDLRKCSISGLFFSIWQILLNSIQSMDVPDIVLGENRQDLMNMFSAAVTDTYLAKMKDVVEDFVKYGYDLVPNSALTTV